MEKGIEKSYTFFMMPFYIKEHQEIKPAEKSIWQRAQMNIDKGILYSHIQEFLSRSVMVDKQTGALPADDTLATHDYHIYSLSEHSKRFTDIMGSADEHAIFVKKTVDGEKVEQHLTFRFNNLKNDYPLFFSPKLIICPNAQVGLLVFSIELSGNKNVEDLIKLNYALFKTYQQESTQSVPIYLPRQIKLIKEKSQIDFRRKLISKKIKTIRMLRQRIAKADNDNAKTNADDNIARINEEISKEYLEYKNANEQFILTCQKILKEKQDFLDKMTSIDKAMGEPIPTTGYHTKDVLSHHWIMRQLTDSLMAEFKGKYERADDYRLHVFTYLQATPEASLDPSLMDDFSRIIRCQDQDYLALPTSLENDIYKQLFENVYIGSAVEGGGVLTFQKGPGDDFMMSFDRGPLVHSYLWVYLLVIMQRHTLLQMSRKLAEEYGYSGKDLNSRLKNLRQLTEKMSKTKINTYFPDVSDHSHLNAIYQFCSNNLAVNKYFIDVDNKLSTLKETLEQLHDEQMEAYKKTEREMDKVQNKIVKWVAVFALALTWFSCLNDSFDYFSNFRSINAERTSSIIYAAKVIGIVIATMVIAWRIVDGVQKKYTNLNKEKTNNNRD